MEEIEEVDETIDTVQRFLHPDRLREIGLDILGNGLQILITFLALYALKKFAEKMIDFYHNRTSRLSRYRPNETATRLLKNIVNYTYYFLLMYSVLSILGVPVATLVAGAGIASLAIGLGAQGFVSDVVNGFFIILEHQYKVGDYIHVGNYQGKVREVGIRITVLEDWEHYIYYIPHRNISEVVNESILPIRYDMDFNVYPDTNFEKFETVVKQAMANAKSEYLDMLTEEPIYYGATRDKDGRFNYRLRVHCTNEDAADVQGYFQMHISQELTKAGIERPMAFESVRSRTFEDVVDEEQKI